ncbi:hypothetical protein GCM10009639_62100 [Kitasatospora putterlickiae]|uniref:Uncharacterized protein n=1 Tax=Kitasatospora putterlickiae TaxID=221725 RepID=A0ABN1YGP9_9ACTN
MPENSEIPETRYEQDLSTAMARAADSFHTETEPLIDTAWGYGRRLRRRRRMSVLAGAAALALVGVGGVAVAGLADGGPGRTVSAAGAPTAGATTAAPVSGQQFLDLFTGLLPAGQIVQVGEARGTESGTPQVRLVHDDGQGRAQYLFWITHSPSWPDNGEGCAYATAPDECTQTITADGSRLVIYKANYRSGEPTGAKMWSATLHTAGGYHVLLEEWNREPMANGTGITRADPPLTSDQLAALVTDPRWQQVIAAIPDHPVPLTAECINDEATAGDGYRITCGTISPSDLASFRASAEAGQNQQGSPSPSLPSPWTPGPSKPPARPGDQVSPSATP